MNTKILPHEKELNQKAIYRIFIANFLLIGILKGSLVKADDLFFEGFDGKFSTAWSSTPSSLPDTNLRPWRTLNVT